MGTVSLASNLDYANAGFNQMLNGNPQLPLGEQALQNMGISKEAAALIYMGIGLVPAFTASTAAEYVANLVKHADSALVPMIGKITTPINNAGAKGVQVVQESKGLQVSGKQALAESFYREAGFSEKRMADHIRGIDFSKKVEVMTIPKGTEVIQYQIPGAPIGSYFALPGTPGNQLGFYTSGRQANTFIAKEDIRVLRSTAVGIVDDWSMKAYNWKIDAPGGGTQFFTPSKVWELKK